VRLVLSLNQEKYLKISHFSSLPTLSGVFLFGSSADKAAPLSQLKASLVPFGGAIFMILTKVHQMRRLSSRRLPLSREPFLLILLSSVLLIGFGIINH